MELLLKCDKKGHGVQKSSFMFHLSANDKIYMTEDASKSSKTIPNYKGSCLLLFLQLRANGHIV
jgi:hypothetical protein